MANSRVGSRMSTRGLPGWCLPRRERIGSAKAAVLPVPVWAEPMRSLPVRATGMPRSLDRASDRRNRRQPRPRAMASSRPSSRKGRRRCLPSLPAGHCRRANFGSPLALQVFPTDRGRGGEWHQGGAASRDVPGVLWRGFGRLGGVRCFRVGGPWFPRRRLGMASADFHGVLKNLLNMKAATSHT